MNNGLPIDLEEVVKLEEELEEIIADVKQRLADNSLVQRSYNVNKNLCYQSILTYKSLDSKHLKIS